MYEGRVDSQIKVRGHRVDLTEVEKAISRIPEIDGVVVLCYKPGELSQVLLIRYFFLSDFFNSLITIYKISTIN